MSSFKSATLAALMMALTNASVTEDAKYWEEFDTRASYYTAIPSGTTTNNTKGYSLFGEYISIRREGEENVRREEQFEWMLTSELTTPTTPKSGQIVQTWAQFGPDTDTNAYEGYTCNYDVSNNSWTVTNYNGPTKFWTPANKQSANDTTEKDRAGPWEVVTNFS